LKESNFNSDSEIGKKNKYVQYTISSSNVLSTGCEVKTDKEQVEQTIRSNSLRNPPSNSRIVDAIPFLFP
jgi:hypothetical protein